MFTDEEIFLYVSGEADPVLVQKIESLRATKTEIDQKIAAMRNAQIVLKENLEHIFEPNLVFINEFMAAPLGQHISERINSKRPSKAENRRSLFWKTANSNIVRSLTALAASVIIFVIVEKDVSNDPIPKPLLLRSGGGVERTHDEELKFTKPSLLGRLDFQAFVWRKGSRMTNTEAIPKRKKAKTVRLSYGDVIRFRINAITPGKYAVDLHQGDNKPISLLPLQNYAKEDSKFTINILAEPPPSKGKIKIYQEIKGKKALLATVEAEINE